MDEQDEDEGQQQLSGGDWPTERVRIVGAETAAVAAGDLASQPDDAGAAPADREQHYLGFVHHPTPPPAPLSPPPLDGGELAAVPPELPHWTDPPTGQVPAIIDRRSDETDDDTWAAFTDSGPVWREHQHEWQDTGGFEPSMLADEGTPLGALDETPVEERRPWEFDDLVAADDDGTDAGCVGDAGGDAMVDADPEDWSRDLDDPWLELRRQDSLPDRGDPGSSSWWDEALDDGTDAGWAARTGVLSADDATGARSSAAVAGASSKAADVPTVASDQAPTRLVPATPSAPAPSPSSEPSWFSQTTRPPQDSTERGSVPAAEAGAAAQRAPRRPPTPARAGSGGPQDNGAGRNVPVAVATGVIAAAVALACFASGSVATLVLATVAMTLAAAEAYASFRRAGMRPATPLGLVATAAVIVTAYEKGVAALPLVAVLLVIATMVWYLIGAEHGSPVAGISSTVLGFAWVGLLGSFAGLMLAPSIYPDRHGVAFALGAVVATVAADVGALAVGSRLGRHQLAPHVSPNKTWEGWVGGAVLAVVASVFITGHVHPWTPGKAAILGVVAAVVAPLGDLCESLVKRDLGLKDMGALLPGHGGVLDRLDGLLFVLPATYYLVRVLHLG